MAARLEKRYSLPIYRDIFMATGCKLTKSERLFLHGSSGVKKGLGLGFNAVGITTVSHLNCIPRVRKSRFRILGFRNLG